MLRMRLYCILIFLSVSLAIFTNCGEDSEEDVDVIENGDIQGTVTDKETGDPIKGATVDIVGKVTSTDKDGKYSLEEILFSDRVHIIVTAADYADYENTISLHQELLFLNIGLAPIDSPSAQILEVLGAFSGDIEALDPDRIPSIQSYLSKDYVVADDEATFLGVFAGVVPPNYDGLPDTILNIVGKYDKLEFDFANPNVEFSGDSASVQMRFEVYAETKPKPPEPAKKWNIVVNGRLDLRKQNGDWKITYWQLIPPFLKFEEEPLEL